MKLGTIEIELRPTHAQKSSRSLNAVVEFSCWRVYDVCLNFVLF